MKKTIIFLLIICPAVLMITSGCGVGSREVNFENPLPIILGIAEFEKEAALNDQETVDLFFFLELEFYEEEDLIRIERSVVNSLRPTGAFSQIHYPAEGNENFILESSFANIEADKEYPLADGYGFPTYIFTVNIDYQIKDQDEEVFQGRYAVKSDAFEYPEHALRDIVNHIGQSFLKEVSENIYPAMQSYLNGMQQ